MRTPRQRYLEKRATTGPWQITGIKRRDYAGAVIIPACDEEKFLFRTLNSLADNAPARLASYLVLVVVNHPRQAEHRVRIANRRLLEQFTASPLRSRMELGWIDACSEGFEMAEGGVGSARKLGFDLALQHLATDIDPILVSLDADTLVEPDYLETICEHFPTARAGAAVIPFAHQPAGNDVEQRAIDQYEMYLRCYLLGLQLAGSPYAFHTIGSAMTCRVSAYLACGGMNRRQGGEDFYFLQSLAKTSGISQLQGTVVYPSARPSTRVPFGTGPAVIDAMDNPGRKAFFPVAAFSLLGRWLKLVEQSIDLDGADLQNRARALDQQLGRFLHHRKFAETWNRLCRNHRDRPRRLRAFHAWFDGLKTLQLVKQLCSDDRIRMLSVEEALDAFFGEIGLVRKESLAECLDLLRRQQNFPDSTGK